jgi:hypothetical protein
MAFELFRGDFRIYELTVVDETDVPIDLTNAEIRYTLKKSVLSPSLIKKATANVSGGGDDQIKIIDAARGLAEIYFKPEDTRNLKAGLYVFDIEVTLPGNKVYTIMKDSLEILEDVTTW